MVTGIELGVGSVLLVVGMVFIRRILAALKTLAGNAVGGVAVLLIAEWFGAGIALTPLSVAVSALVGIPGAILLVMFSFGGIEFARPVNDMISHLTVDQIYENIRQLIATSQQFIIR
ncbi:pro-sigmaK processing inhibitor BofA family protein [Halococcus sp. IIIV-5B]|uniref:pro-sigmaK processing inhibitor BofA family protein n=1 Tax=Halococcus sp. IIIV-5B TaxID=2321230 RepID=UPI000E7462CC|nr:pro-sigmaK processing inhibitor BofA family protein [Halococcus sp. IIIV-5B]RJT07094.1 hypothetical protein D3261_03540 [Halococcus sp. IIIV-5B]